MSFVVVFALILLATTVPDLCPRALSLAAHPPDVWLAVVVYIALRARGFRAVGWGILLGVVRDCLSLDPLGTHAFVLGTIAWLFCEGRRHRSPIEGLGAVLLTLVAALLAGWLYLLRLLPIGGGIVSFGDALHVVPTALFTALFAGLLFPLLDHFRLLDDLGGRRRGLQA